MDGGLLEKLKSFLLDPHRGEQVLRDAGQAGERPVPVIWLLGKTQSGKSSIVSALTGHPHAQVGNGYEPCTRTAGMFDFPAGVPVLRFLDTRGLGEVAYDPREDIAACAAQAHVILAVVRASDPRPQPVFDVLRAVRRTHPDWPVIVAQTCLHDLYPRGADHLDPDPFAAEPPVLPDDYQDLSRMLAGHRRLLADLPGAAVQWVPVDLTQPEDGYGDPHYGLGRLWDVLETALPHGLAMALRQDAPGDDFLAAARQQITGHAIAAAGLGAVPLVDLVAVAAIQGKMLHALARMAGQKFEAQTVGEFVGLLGGGIAASWLLGQAGRTVVKLVPGWGQTLGAVWGATQAGATTYALGQVGARFFDARRRGLATDADALKKVYAEELAAGRALLKERLRG